MNIFGALLIIGGQQTCGLPIVSCTDIADCREKQSQLGLFHTYILTWFGSVAVLLQTLWRDPARRDLQFLYNWGSFFEGVSFTDDELVLNMYNIKQWNDGDFNIKERSYNVN